MRMRRAPAMFLALLASTLLGLATVAPGAQATFPGGAGKIAFSRGPVGSFDEGDIWVALPSGEQRRLTHTPMVDETDPAFSPNGELIVYTARRQGEDADVWMMRANGRGQHALVEGTFSDFQASFFPSGRAVVYSV